MRTRRFTFVIFPIFLLQKTKSLRREDYDATRELSIFQVNDKIYKCDEGCGLNNKSNNDAVCGDNGAVYQNECLAICQGIKIVPFHFCPQGDVFRNGVYDVQSSISRSEIDRFRKENFVFIGKRKFAASEQMRKEFDTMIRNGGSFRDKSGMKQHDVFALRVTNDGYEYYSNMKDNKIVSLDATPFHIPQKDAKKQNHLRRRELKVFGADGRSKVCLHESCYPYSSIGEFDSVLDGQGGCTGTVISESAVLTVAHCHYLNGTWSDYKTFAPGRYLSYDGDVINPYGVWEFQSRTVFYSWAQNHAIEHDMAVIKTKPKDGVNIGDVVGWLSIAPVTNVSRDLKNVTITGYPNDKDKGEMWTSGECSHFAEGTHHVLITHDCDTVTTNSGSALLDIEHRTVYGVHVETDLYESIHYNSTNKQLKNTAVILHDTNFASIKRFSGVP